MTQAPLVAQHADRLAQEEGEAHALGGDVARIGVNVTDEVGLDEGPWDPARRWDRRAGDSSLSTRPPYAGARAVCKVSRADVATGRAPAGTVDPLPGYRGWLLVTVHGVRVTRRMRSRSRGWTAWHCKG